MIHKLRQAQAGYIDLEPDIGHPSLDKVGLFESLQCTINLKYCLLKFSEN